MRRTRQGANRSATREPMRPRPTIPDRDSRVVVGQPRAEIGAHQGRVAPEPVFYAPVALAHLLEQREQEGNRPFGDAAPIALGSGC